MKKSSKFTYEWFGSADELTEKDFLLLSEARKVTKYAYAPYSRFRVGAVAFLANGETVSGTNQENASYPAGICAERVLLSVAASLYPGVAIRTIAISYRARNAVSDRPVTPCGICRQSLREFEERTGNEPIRLILAGLEGPVAIIEDAKDLLPLAFTSGDLK